MTYYMYIHCRPDGSPFYVGKGTLRRALLKHRPENPHYQNVVSKYGKENIQVKLLQCATEELAFAAEIATIKSFRLQGERLVNIANGGEGSSGVVLSEAQKQLRSNISKNLWKSTEYREKVVTNAAKAVKSPEYKAKASERMLEQWQNQSYRELALTNQKLAVQRLEYREKLSKRLKELCSTPEMRAVKSRVATEAGLDPKLRKVRSENTTRLWQSDDHREKVVASLKSTLATPEAKAKKVKVGKALAESPEWKAKVGAASKRMWESEEYRRKHKEAVAKTTSTAEYKAKASERTKTYWDDPAYREKMPDFSKLQWVNNGSVNKRVPANELEAYRAQGFVPGRFKAK